MLNSYVDIGGSVSSLLNSNDNIGQAFYLGYTGQGVTGVIGYIQDRNMTGPLYFSETGHQGLTGYKFVGSILGALNTIGSQLAGPTSSRPGDALIGTEYFDTDLGIPVWYDGSNWRDGGGSIA